MGKGVKGSGYINNDELVREIALSRGPDRLTPRAVEMLWLICQNANKRLKYKDPMDRDDCVAGGMLEILKYWRSFKPERGTNAFAYYTQCAKNGYAKTWAQLHPQKTKGTISMDRANDGDGIYNL